MRKEGASGRAFEGSLRAIRSGIAGYADMPVQAFTKADLRACRDKIIERGAMSMARNFIAYLSPIFKWAVEEEYVEFNVARDLRKPPVTKRERTLTHAELKAIWRASFEVGPSRHAANFGRLIRFAMLTGQRREECAQLRYGDVIDGNLWHQRKNKTNRPHRLRLPPLAMAQVHTGSDSSMTTDFCFEGDPGKAISGWSKFKAALDAKAKIELWRIHDLRRTMASGMQDLNFDEMTINATLNHVLPGISQVYMRSTLEPQKAAALAKWADQVERIVSSGTSSATV